MLLHDIMTEANRKWPGKAALKFAESQWTYAELYRDTAGLAHQLTENGVEQDHKVGIFLPSGAKFIMSFFALSAVGATIVPVNINFPVSELAAHLLELQVTCVVTDQLLYDRLASCSTVRQSLKKILVFSDCADRHVIPGNPPADSVVWLSPDPDCNMPLDSFLPVKRWDTEPAFIQYTSGTTDRSKGAVLSHRALLSNARTVSEMMQMSAADHTLCVMPMCQIFAISAGILIPVLSGGKVTVLEKFQPKSVLRSLLNDKITVFFGSPGIYSTLLKYQRKLRYSFPDLRLSYSASAALPVKVFREYQELFGMDIIQRYGLSECSPACTGTPLNEKVKPGSVGPPLPGVQIKIVDANGSELQPGESGEIIVKGPNLMSGYCNSVEGEQVIKNGWLYTGDIGYFDEDDYLYINGRKKDVIIVSGFNVNAREVEEVILEHPCVDEGAVIGIPDALTGERVKAVVVLRSGASLTEKELIKFCGERLIRYKWPKVVEFRKYLPKTSAGKILKRLLVERDIAENEQDNQGYLAPS